MENNHECIICGNGYYACNKCDKINSWRRYVDTPSCYQLYLIIEEYMHEVISKVEARKLLANIGITSERKIIKSRSIMFWLILQTLKIVQ